VTEESSEISLALMEDLATAIKNVAGQLLPGMKLDVRVVTSPRIGLSVSVAGTEDYHRYPYFHRAEFVGRPTAYLRRKLGLPEVRE